jgi:predicted Rossmann-fold nucleotide-binding protein
MNEPRAGTTKRLWLWLLLEGGYSSVTEIAEALGMERKPLDKTVIGLCDRGYLEKVAQSARAKNAVAFGVTPRCKVPQGVMLQELVLAGAVRGPEA